MDRPDGHTFTKEERLCGKSAFERLLQEGNAFISYPLRVVFRVSERGEKDYPVRMAVSVSKKRFKRAVKRNRVKRLVREAYRLNKPSLYEVIPPGETVDLLLIFLGDSLPAYDKIDKSIKGVIKKLRNNREKNSSSPATATD